MEKFSQMPYRRPDLAAAKALIEATAEKIRSAQTAKSALEAHAAYRAESADLETMYTLASIRNTMNTLDEYYEGEMNFFNENLPALSVAEKAVSAAILESPFVDAFREAYGELWLHDLRVAQRLADEKIVPEQIEQAKLCQEGIFQNRRRVRDGIPRRELQFLCAAQAYAKRRPRGAPRSVSCLEPAL